MSARVHEQRPSAAKATRRDPASVRAPVTAAPSVETVCRSHGEPLNKATREAMEGHFGHDFSRVRVHSDAEAAASADAIRARAYTVGRNVVFGRGAYQPGTPRGERLIAHELAHTIQQDPPTGTSGPLRVSSPHSPAEAEARAAGEGWTAGRPHKPRLRTGVVIHRDEDSSTRKVFIEEGFTGRGNRGAGQAARAQQGVGRRRSAGGRTGEGDTAGESETGTGENTGDRKGGEELDPVTSLASLILEQDSLAVKERNTTGKTGPPVGSKSGFISGWLGKALAVVAAALSVAGAVITKAFKKAVGYAKKTFASLRDKLGLGGGVAPARQLPPPLTPDEQKFHDWAQQNGLSEKDLDAMKDMPEAPPSPNQQGTVRVPDWRKPGAGRKRP